MLSELRQELIEDSPFLRKIYEDAYAEGLEEGREEIRADARALLREIAKYRFPDLSDVDLAPIATIMSLRQIYRLAGTVLRLPDADAFRQAAAAAACVASVASFQSS